MRGAKVVVTRSDPHRPQRSTLANAGRGSRHEGKLNKKSHVLKHTSLYQHLLKTPLIAQVLPICHMRHIYSEKIICPTSQVFALSIVSTSGKRA
ncbi:hypothetical protein EG68_03082 [Paragonimus skrjabini miyazakii]|uniref:Uncharacterized protein n=1 Tax=Paragonimus skrjabini miyazakii TaxID=59628 RepID=A0A8S9Z3K1_9TREM|nr:hypothetical protein EG68_03082 [Paragonimus skrjabini miyazakii]